MNTAPSGAVKEYSSQAEPPAPPTASRLPALVGQAGPPANPSTRTFFYTLSPARRRLRRPPLPPARLFFARLGGACGPPCQSFYPDIFSHLLTVAAPIESQPYRSRDREGAG